MTERICDLRRKELGCKCCNLGGGTNRTYIEASTATAGIVVIATCAKRLLT